MRSLVLAAVAALTFAGAASAATDAYMLFKFDAKGVCRDNHGHFATASKCKPAPVQCRDPHTGRFIKCAADLGGPDHNPNTLGAVGPHHPN